MKRDLRRPLVILNVVLLAGVVLLGVAPRAGAQNQPERARGAYTMVAGRVQGGSNDVVYIIDSANQEVIALIWDLAQSDLRTIGYRNLSSDAQTQHGGR